MKLRCLRPRLAPAPSNGWKPDSVRGTRQQRGYGAEWERQRKRALVRDEYLCQPCRRAGRDRLATDVDHIVPKTRGGSDGLENLQAICRSCHREKTAAESRGL